MQACRRPLSALLVVLALLASQAAVCAGWMPTPEARMACCADGAACPMHASHSSSSSSTRVASQAEADRCCASSEQNDAAPAASGFAPSVGLALVPSPLPLDVPVAFARHGDWRTLAPAPGTPVPKHLLLSVFLV